MTLVKSFEVDAAPDQVASVLCSAEFNVEAESEREEVLHTRHVVLQQSKGGMVFEVQSTEYKRKKTGGLDRSGTVQSVIRNTYDARARTLSWDYQGAGSRWVSVHGVYRLSALASGTRVVHKIDIDVRIPLLGGQIARLIAGEFDAAAQRFERLLRRHVAA